MTHEIKCWPEFMHDLATGRKSFEVRKNDRDYLVGDMLLIREFNPEKKVYGLKKINAEIIYILKGGQFGIEKGYIVMGLQIIDCNF